MAIGVAGEAVSGTWFEGMPDPRYPRNAARFDDEAIKTRLGRLTFWLGAVLTVVGGITDLT